CGWKTQPISTLNPALAEQDNVVPSLPFNLFTDTLQEPADIIKCANLLNQEYFSDTELCDGVENLIRSLTPEGVLVVSQNNARFRNGEAVVVLQRGTQGVSVTEKQGNHPVAALFVTSEAAP
ncbi:MAG: hypothetical protein KKC99_04225, partial [Proteobacteria bacterium]|nr:hypothetical protein [Pseudomonadota bacterium]